jgi:hypothetical protein
LPLLIFDGAAMVVDKQFWAEHVAAIERERISANAYAKRESISVAAIYYWQRKLRAAAADVSTPARSFVQLRVAEAGPHSKQGCTLVLASGMRLEMGFLPSPEWLAGLVRATPGAV